MATVTHLDDYLAGFSARMAVRWPRLTVAEKRQVMMEIQAVIGALREVQLRALPDLLEAAINEPAAVSNVIPFKRAAR